MESRELAPTDWMVLINPMAGNGRGCKDWPGISRRLAEVKIACQHRFTEYPRHSLTLIHNFLRQGYRRFIIAGGDGFLNEAVNALFTQTIAATNQVTLAMLPVGTGNDWVRSFNIPFDYAAAIRTIQQGKTLLHDVGRVFYHSGGREESWYFLNMCGIGFDAAVNQKVTADRERNHLGPLKYRYHIFTTLMGYASTRMKIVIDGNEVNHEVFSLALGNAQYNGGGMKQLPFAIANDGSFDITVIKKITRLKALRSVNKLYDGSFVELPEVATYTGKVIQIESTPACRLEADGEGLGESPFRFEILPQALRVIIG